MTNKRPGGLTALAVLNFVFGGLSIVAALGALAILKYADKLAENASAKDRATFEAFQQHSAVFWIAMVTGMFAAALLIASGVGYLKLKKVLGRTLGTVYGILGVASTIIRSFLTPAELGGGMSIGTIIGLIYPVLTLFLLNVTFKQDFEN